MPTRFFKIRIPSLSNLNFHLPRGKPTCFVPAIGFHVPWSFLLQICSCDFFYILVCSSYFQSFFCYFQCFSLSLLRSVFFFNSVWSLLQFSHSDLLCVSNILGLIPIMLCLLFATSFLVFPPFASLLFHFFLSFFLMLPISFCWLKIYKFHVVFYFSDCFEVLI